MGFKRIHFLGLPLDVGGDIDDICELLREKKAGCTIALVGPRAFALAQKDSQYRAALEQMTLVLPDGPGVSFLCEIMTRQECEFFSLDYLPFAEAFYAMAVESKLKLVLAGGAPGADEEAHTKLNVRYPELNIGQTVHAYGDFDAKIAALKSKASDMLIVGMKPPRQEVFVTALRDGGYKGNVISCEDYFDYFDYFPAVLQPDPAPSWVDRWCLRYFYRMYHKPQKLWRRYVVDYPVFVGIALKSLFDRLAAQAQGTRKK